MNDNRTTELLREGLTERGIEWRSGLEGVTFVGDWCFVEYDNGRLAATCEPVLTPEQAVAATLGGGECEYVIEDNMNESEGMGDVWFRCTNCNTTFDYYADDWLMKQNHCPHCGFKIRKVVGE